jgi:hypothetical protein
MAKSTHRGSCQICGKDSMLPGGFVAKHGYQVADIGFFHGTCRGAGYPPYETSCVALDVLKIELEEMIESHHKLCTSVQNDETKIKAFVRVPSDYTYSGYNPMKWMDVAEWKEDSLILDNNNKDEVKTNSIIGKNRNECKEHYMDYLNRRTVDMTNELSRINTKIEQWSNRPELLTKLK